MTAPDPDQPRRSVEGKNDARIRRRSGFISKKQFAGATCICAFAYLGTISIENSGETPLAESSRSRELNAIIGHRGFIKESSLADAGVEERVAPAVAAAVVAAGTTEPSVMISIRHRGFVLDQYGTPIASTKSEVTKPENFLKTSTVVLEPKPTTHDEMEPKSSAGKLPIATADAEESPMTRNNEDATKVTFYLTTPVENPAWSIFLAHTLQRYGSGRAHYVIDNDATCDPPPEPISTPCVAVTRDRVCSAERMRSVYPGCKTMTTNDEFCRAHNYDVREYYSSNMPNKAYLPLGPRLEAWQSFQKIKETDTNEGEEFEIIPASKRKYAFNAIFSKETSAGREELSEVLRKNEELNGKMSTYIRIAEKKASRINSPKNDMVNTREYMRVLLDSAFTLAPTGHNPECFRLYEAAEAGSVPVFAKDERYDRHPCRDSLHAWVEESPIVVVDGWEEVHSTVAELMEDPRGLDERQGRLREWYGKYMRETVGKFESYMLDGGAASEI